MASNKRSLQAYVRYDGTGRIIPGSLILNRFKPAVGGWKETPAYECCNTAPIPINFDVIGNWDLTYFPVTDAASFKLFLESGYDGNEQQNSLTDVVITGFSLVDGRLQCNLSATGTILYLGGLGITEVISISNITGLGTINLDNNLITSVNDVIWPSGLFVLELSSNDISNFDPINPLPSGLQLLGLGNNNIITFDPTIALPNVLQDLNLQDNSIGTFNPSIALPTALQTLTLSGNQIVNFNPLIALPNGLMYLFLTNNQIITFNPSAALPNGLQYLFLSNNEIVTFNPSIPLPNSLYWLVLGNNRIVTFNPTIPLPSTIFSLQLQFNLMTTIGYTGSEPWANAMSVIPGRGTVNFNGNTNSVSGTALETILTSKGWGVVI
jgi:hypothetical protein